MNCDFSFKHYRHILEELLNNNFKVKSFYGIDFDQSKQVIIRHDVDFGLHYESVLDFAETEKSLGVSSTWFVLLRSPFYNLYSSKELVIVKKLLKDGNDIGLHFDGAIYKDFSCADLEKAIVKEKEMLENIIEAKVSSFSFHRPAASNINVSKVLLSSILNAYDKRFTSESFTYISDSRKHWRNGCACRRLQDKDVRNLQLLTHPFWWNEKDLGLTGRFNEFFEQILSHYDESLDSNIKDWNNERYGTKFCR